MTFTLRPHQEKLATDVLADLRRGDPEVLLAGCPGFGKTETAIEIISRLLAEGAVKRVLVLAHGMRILRTQFEERILKRRPELLTSGNVQVRLHQEHRKIDGSFDLVVVDEAHHFYEAPGGMASRIIRRAGARQVLLLTGTPAPFIRRGLKVHALALLDLCEAGFASEVEILMMTSAYDIGEKDWNDAGEVKSSIAYGRAATQETVGRAISRLGGRDAILESKTIIACRGKGMAAAVSRELDQVEIDHLVSESEEDPKSSHVKAFTEGKFPVLVVVDRAQLGFDMPELESFVDLTGSRNPDRIFQMMCRVVRKAKVRAGAKKFLKAMPAVFEDEIESFMTGVAHLSRRDLYTTWDGGSWLRLRVPTEGGSERNDSQGAPSKPTRLEPRMKLFGDLFRGLAGQRFMRIGDVQRRSMPDGATEKKARILMFFERERRWPRNNNSQEEGHLGAALRRYTRKDGPQYDSKFHAEALDMAPLNSHQEHPKGRRLKTQSRIVSFFERNGRWPRQKSADVSERQLGAAHHAYVGAGSKRFDRAYRQAVERLGWRARRVMTIAVLVKGKQETKTIAEWASIVGITEQSFANRVKRGMKGELLLKKVSRSKIKIKGKAQGIKAWAIESGVPRTTLRRRLEKGIRGAALLRPTSTASATVLQAIRSNAGATPREIASVTGVSAATVRRVFRFIKAHGATGLAVSE